MAPCFLGRCSAVSSQPLWELLLCLGDADAANDTGEFKFANGRRIFMMSLVIFVGNEIKSSVRFMMNVLRSEKENSSGFSFLRITVWKLKFAQTFVNELLKSS